MRESLTQFVFSTLAVSSERAEDLRWLAEGRKLPNTCLGEMKCAACAFREAG